MNDNQPRGSLIDDLIASTPQANPEFQRQLEERLMLELYTEKNGRKNDIINAQTAPIRPLSKLPLTLAAAVMALILVGSVLVFRTNPSSQPMIGAQATDEPVSSQSSFEYGGEVIDPSSEDTILAMQRSGMTWMKYQMTYSDVADEPKKMIDAAHDAGFKILLTVGGDPAHLDQANYVNNYAKWLADASLVGADAIEVWTEPNLDRNWVSDEIGGAAYVELLRQAYETIKLVSPDTLVISAAPAPTGGESDFPGQVMNDDRWLREVVESGGLEYLDCVGAQYVEGVVPPGKTSDDPRDNYYTRYFGSMVLAYQEIIKEQKPLCFTSLGYLSDDGLSSLAAPFAWAENTTVGQQSAWLGEAVRLASMSGKVHLIIVWNVDFTEYDAMPYAGYAIIRPDGSCPACDALEVFSLDSNLFPPTNLQPVVIARYDLPAGTRIDEGRLAIVYWPMSMIPAGAISKFDTIDGQMLEKNVARWQPILQYQVSVETISDASSFQITPQTDEAWAFRLAEDSDLANRVIVNIPVDQLRQPQTLHAGDHVTVLATMSFIQTDDRFFVPVPPDSQGERAVIYTTPILEAIIVGVELTATGNIVQIATSATDAITLSWVVQAKVPITLVVSQDNPGS